MPQDELAGALAGQPGAWDRLVRRYERLLRDVGRQYRLAPADVDDAMQTTWLQLFRRMHAIRDARGAARLARHDDAARVPAHDPAPGQRGAAWATSRSRIRSPRRTRCARCSRPSAARRSGEALAALPKRHRDLMLLLTDSLSYAEVSDRLGMPLGSIGPIRSRSLARLRARRGAPASLRLSVAHRDRELAARADAELAVDARQVRLDRLRAEEQVGGRLLVRRAARDAARDLQLLRRQSLAVALRAARARAGRCRRARGALAPPSRAPRARRSTPSAWRSCARASIRRPARRRRSP